MIPSRVEIYASAGPLMSAACLAVADIARRAIGERGVCTLALSGGETPRDVYRRLAQLGEPASPDWSRVHLCFGDERMVHPDDPESNYGMVRDALIAGIPIPAGHVHRIRGERPHDVAAREYAEEMESVLPLSGGRLDLVLLGLGEDGHTASLFPGTTIIGERRKPADAVFVPRLSAWRVSLTLPVINAARDVLFLVSGGGKASILHRVLGLDAPDAGLPASLVATNEHPPRWLVDEQSAALLPPGAGRRVA